MEQNSKLSIAFVTHTWLILLFLICIFIGVNGTIRCWQEDPTSGERTRQFCSARNSSLLYMTVGVQKTLLNHFQTTSLSDNDQVSSWTNHHVKRQFFDEGNIYFSEFPFSDDVPFNEASIFCIYATFYLNNNTVGWVPSNCNDNYLNSVDCCYTAQKNIEALNATLYTVAVAWYTAENYCSKEGSNLLNLTQPINLYLSFVKTPWLSSGVTKFWTGHSSLEIFENLEIAKKYDIAEMEINQTGCVYVIVENQYQNFPKIQLGIDSCNNTKDGFICLKPTQYMYFDRSPNFIYTSNYLKYDGQPYTISECEDECEEMTKNGYACIGFNYNKANSSCQFKETMFGGSYTIRYDSDWISVDFTHHHAIAGNYTPKQIAVSTSSVTNNEGVTALSYLYDRNDQATLPSEKTIIRGSENTSDYPAATNNINTDTSFLVTINEGVTALSYLYDRNDQATLPSEKTIIRGSENTSDYPAATNNINTDTSFLGKTFTVGACVVAAVAGVVVLGATFIGILKIKQKGRNSSIICSSHNVEDSLSNGKHEVSGLTSLNNFLNKPPGNYQVGRQRNKPHNNQH